MFHNSSSRSSLDPCLKTSISRTTETTLGLDGGTKILSFEDEHSAYVVLRDLSLHEEPG